MSSKLIIVTDMQRFKLFSLKKDPMGRESVELVENMDNLEAHERLSEKVSDRQGNFQGVGASGSGEDHNLSLEEERRRLKEISEQISDALQRHEHTSWYFSAPKAINNKIVELLSPSHKASMEINLHLDLTKIHDDELLSHFVQ